MMLSPTSVPPSPVSMPSQMSGGMEAQLTQSPFHGVQVNPVEGVRDSQGMMTAEQRQMSQSQPPPQPLRELSAPRMASPRIPMPQQPKPDMELQAGIVDRQPVHTAPMQDSEVSPTLRTAPTSLNQLLDNTGMPAMPHRPVQSNTVRDVMGKDSPKSALDAERPLHSNSQSTDVSASASTTATINESEAKPKSAVQIPSSSPNLQHASVPSSHPGTKVNTNTTPSLNQNPISSVGVSPSPNINPTPTLSATLSTNTNATTSVSPTPVQSSPASTVGTSSNPSTALNQASSGHKPSPSPKPVTSVHSVIQIPASSSTISPNQITVFVTSNPITSAPTPQAPTSMVSTMVAVPNKNIRPQDIRQQAPGPRPPQFITTTPVFINPIFQVPGASVTPNTSVVSQSVTMMGPIQVSTTNIQLSPAPSSTQSSGAIMASTQAARNAVGQVQLATTVSSAAPLGPLPPSQQINPGGLKTENLGEASPAQKTSPPGQQPSPHPSPSASSPFQPPLASPPPSSSPGAVNTIRKSPMSPPPSAQVKGKPAQSAAAVAGTADSQQCPAERPVQGPTGAVPTQIFHPPASPAIQMEAVAPLTTAAAASNNITPPAVSSPIPVPSQVAVPTQIVTQAPVPAPASVSSPAQVVTTQAPIVTVAGTPTGVSSASLLSTVTPVQSPVPSVVPIVAGPGSVQEVPPTTSSPGVPPAQSEPPPMEPPMPPAAPPTETTQTTPGKLICEQKQSLVIYISLY